MTDLHKIRAAQVHAAEQAAIAELPPELLASVAPEVQAPEGAQVAALRQALEDAATSLETVAKNAGRVYDTDGYENLLEHHDQVRGYAASRASAARAALAAQPQAPVALTDAVLKGAAEYWHEYGDGPGAEVSRRKAALLAFKAGARFAEGHHGITQTKEPTNDR